MLPAKSLSSVVSRQLGPKSTSSERVERSRRMLRYIHLREASLTTVYAVVCAGLDLVTRLSIRLLLLSDGITDLVHETRHNV